MSKETGKSKSFKVETVEEYLARGGTIKRIPEASRLPTPDIVRKTVSGGPAVFLSMDDADLFYGEARKGSKPKKSKSAPGIDFNALPAALRVKFIARLKEEANGEGYKEELEDLTEEENEEDDSDEE